MPIALASVGEVNRTGAPSKTISPASGVSTPDRHLTNADLPAPLSPTSATTSPARASNDAPRSASTVP